MSSSDELLDWSRFKKRQEPFPVEILSPASEVAALLQRTSAEVDAARRQTAEADHRGRVALAGQAVLTFQLAAAIELYREDLEGAALTRAHRHFRVLKDQMLDGLRTAGLEIEDPLGRSFDEVADAVHVDGWRHGREFAGEQVAEVLEPIVTDGDQILRLGRVIMGAPEEDAPDQDAVTAPSTPGET